MIESTDIADENAAAFCTRWSLCNWLLGSPYRRLFDS